MPGKVDGFPIGLALGGRNDQYRICFRWEDGYADKVEVTDYH